MTDSSLSSGATFLQEAAERFFQDLYEIPNILNNSELHKDLNWTPALRFLINDHIHVFVEPSEISPYPRIFSLRHADVLQFPEPIAAYCVCPEDVALDPSKQSDIHKLEEHGFGLITVNGDGTPHRRILAIPLIQVVPRTDYKAQLEGLTPKLKQKIAQAFEDYGNKPSTGVSTLTEVVEGFAMGAAKEAAKKSWITNAQANGGLAGALDAMYACNPCNNARAAIGGVRAYIANFRNISHHWPKNKKRAHQKYLECRHAFLEGMRQIRSFRTSMKNIGLSGNLPKG